MEDWEKELRAKLNEELEDKLYQVGEGEWVAFTGKQGYIDCEVEIERTFRQALSSFDKKKDDEETS